MEQSRRVTGKHLICELADIFGIRRVRAIDLRMRFDDVVVATIEKNVTTEEAEKIKAVVERYELRLIEEPATEIEACAQRDFEEYRRRRES